MVGSQQSPPIPDHILQTVSVAAINHPWECFFDNPRGLPALLGPGKRAVALLQAQAPAGILCVSCSVLSASEYFYLVPLGFNRQ